MKDLCKAVADTQPRNAMLMLRLAVPISRLACGDTALLAQTRALVDRAAATYAPRPPPPAIAAEAAQQQLLNGHIADAARALRALRVSAPSTTAALLTAEADALGGDPAAAAATVEAYDDTLDSADERAHATYVSALATALSQPSLERAAAAIEAAVQAQLDTVQVRLLLRMITISHLSNPRHSKCSHLHPPLNLLSVAVLVRAYQTHWIDILSQL